MRYETLFKKILVEKDLSYKIFSIMTGLSKTSIYYYANGERLPDIKSAITIANALHIDIRMIDRLFEPTN